MSVSPKKPYILSFGDTHDAFGEESSVLVRSFTSRSDLEWSGNNLRRVTPES